MKEYIDKYLIKQDIFFECTLLEYIYLDSEQTFIWIGSPGMFTDFDLSKNPFIRMCFTEVSEFIRIFPDFKPFKPNRFEHCYAHFFSKDFTGVYDSENCYLTKLENDKYQIKIVMNFLLGTVQFNFTGFNIEIKYSKFIKSINGDKGRFLDIETNQEIDIYQPFGKIRND
jgi:hypothetical protein